MYKTFCINRGDETQTTITVPKNIRNRKEADSSVPSDTKEEKQTANDKSSDVKWCLDAKKKFSVNPGKSWGR